jgi:hypothetical protein
MDGRPNSGDKIVFTYTTVMNPASILAGWSGASTNVQANFSRQSGQSTQLQICTTTSCNTVVNLGSVDLGDPSGNRYLTNSGTSVNLSATMVMTTVSGRSVVTITLTASSGTLQQLSPQTTTTVLQWTPDSGATDLANGIATDTTPINESGSPKRNF